MEPLMETKKRERSNSIGSINLPSYFTLGYRKNKKHDARKVLSTRPSGVVLGDKKVTIYDKEMVKKANIKGVIFPWTPAYKVWWSITTAAAMLTVFFGPYMVAFQKEPGTFNDAAGVIEWILNIIFAVDIGINFNLAFYKNDIIVLDRKEIAREYSRLMFWVDFVGVFPFEAVALLFTEATNQRHSLLCSLLRLLRYVRLHRVKTLSDMLQVNARVSLLCFTLLRNLAAVLVTTHLAACSMYFIARVETLLGHDTWLGPHVQGMTGLDRYVVSLYWSVVTFCTVGYGDFAPMNSIEQIFGMIFMIVNIVLAAWIIGSITLLVVKGDEKTGEYRDTLQTLHQYTQMHHFDHDFSSSLKSQLRLGFYNRDIADEQVLKNFPSSVRRKILRKLYLEPLTKTQLMEGIRQKFVDAFLASCTVEIFSPGEVIVERGSILSDLFLLVGGIAEVTDQNVVDYSASLEDSSSSSFDADAHLKRDQLESGAFINDIPFFTESPQIDSVVCLTVCKTLTISQSAYKLLAQDHPGSVGKILHNLLDKVKEMEKQLPTHLAVLRAGSNFDIKEGYGSIQQQLHPSTTNHHHHNEPMLRSSIRHLLQNESREAYDDYHQRQEALTAIKDLVEMHMGKQLDDQTTRFCFASSRGDTATIQLMCSQGFNPNNADYDSRTGLMVAAMKGNTEVAKMLLEYKANPNLTDMHGSTALLEAVKNGHESTMKMLMDFGAELCLPESLAASVLCQAVFDGNILLLRRLLLAGIQVNAADYDKRTAAHIAAAEGNVAAIRILAEGGADLTLMDRWGNKVQEEAERSNARQLLEFLKNRDDEMKA